MASLQYALSSKVLFRHTLRMHVSVPDENIIIGKAASYWIKFVPNVLVVLNSQLSRTRAGIPPIESSCELAGQSPLDAVVVRRNYKSEMHAYPQRQVTGDS
jgi:hypothetical protein